MAEQWEAAQGRGAPWEEAGPAPGSPGSPWAPSKAAGGQGSGPAAGDPANGASWAIKAGLPILQPSPPAQGVPAGRGGAAEALATAGSGRSGGSGSGAGSPALDDAARLQATLERQQELLEAATYRQGERVE